MDKEIVKKFCIGSAIVTAGTLLASVLYSKAFIPSFLLMFALTLFAKCYYIKDEKKNMMYLLFVLVVLLIIASLVYTYMRLS